MQILLATTNDADDIAAVLLAAFREFESLYTAAAFRATTPPASEISARLSEGPTWIARLEDRAVGTVSGVDLGAEVYVRSMAVVPDARGRGVASALLVAVTAFAVNRGARRLRLSTTPFLEAAIRLYERSGFERSPEPLDLHGTPLIAMTKELVDVSNGRISHRAILAPRAVSSSRSTER